MSPVVNKLKRPLVRYEDAANPEAWRAVGRRLMTSTEFLWKPLNEAIEGFVATRGDRSPEQAAKYGALADHFGAFFVLAGFAVENYLKACRARPVPPISSILLLASGLNRVSDGGARQCLG